MFLRRFLGRFLFVPKSLRQALRPRCPRNTRPRKPRLEQLEDRVAPALLGLASELVTPDITSGAITTISYTQLGNNANPFNYSAVALALTQGNGAVSLIGKPTTGSATVALSMFLDNNGAFSSGVPTGNLTVTGKVTANAQVFNGTLLTEQVRGFGFSTPNPTDTESEV